MKSTPAGGWSAQACPTQANATTLVAATLSRCHDGALRSQSLGMRILDAREPSSYLDVTDSCDRPNRDRT